MSRGSRWPTMGVPLRLFLLALAAHALPLSGLAAQADPDSIKHRNNCRLAEQVLRTGNPQPHRAWARGYISTCEPDSVAEFLVELLGEAASTGDRDTLEPVFFMARVWPDERVFDTLLGVAGNVGATVEARVQALATLMVFLDPTLVPRLDGIRAGVDASGVPLQACYVHSTHAQVRQEVAHPLRATAWADTRELARALWEDVGSPSAVRAAAYCIM